MYRYSSEQYVKINRREYMNENILIKKNEFVFRYAYYHDRKIHSMNIYFT